MLSPGDVIVVDVMDIDNVLMVVFVVGSETIFNSAEMINIMQTVGPQIAQELEDALMSLVRQPNFTKGHCMVTVIIGLIDSKNQFISRYPILLLALTTLTILSSKLLSMALIDDSDVSQHNVRSIIFWRY